MKNIYVCGPQRGHENYHPARRSALRRYLKDRFGKDCQIIDPSHSETAADSMTREREQRVRKNHLRALLDADGICFLPGWRDCNIARTEERVAWETGTTTVDLPAHLTVDFDYWQTRYEEVMGSDR